MSLQTLESNVHLASCLLHYALLCILPEQHHVLFLDPQQKLEPNKAYIFLIMEDNGIDSTEGKEYGQTSELNSAKTDMACDRRSGLSTGTSNSYMVSSEEVKAF